MEKLEIITGLLDLRAMSSRALEAAGHPAHSADLVDLAQRTVVHLETANDFDIALISKSTELCRNYFTYLHSFKLELIVAELWDLHGVLRGSANPFAVARAASDVKGRVASLIDRVSTAQA